MICTKSVTIKGVSPLMMGNNRSCNPSDKFYKLLKPLQKHASVSYLKSDHNIRFHNLLWQSFLNTNDNDQLIIPQNDMQRCLIKAGKRQRQEDLVETACFVDNDAILEYDGPKDLAELQADENFHNKFVLDVGKGPYIRWDTPIFRSWGANFRITYDSSILSSQDFDNLLDTAGRYCGLGSFRYHGYGRFEVCSVPVELCSVPVPVGI